METWSESSTMDSLVIQRRIAFWSITRQNFSIKGQIIGHFLSEIMIKIKFQWLKNKNSISIFSKSIFRILTALQTTEKVKKKKKGNYAIFFSWLCSVLKTPIITQSHMNCIFSEGKYYWLLQVKSIVTNQWVPIYLEVLQCVSFKA